VRVEKGRTILEAAVRVEKEAQTKLEAAVRVEKGKTTLEAAARVEKEAQTILEADALRDLWRFQRLPLQVSSFLRFYFLLYVFFPRRFAICPPILWSL